MSDEIRWHLGQMFKLEKQMDAYEAKHWYNSGVNASGPNMAELQEAQRLVPRHQPLGPNMTEMQREEAVDRAVHNSLPPLDDVGADVAFMQDPKDPDFVYSDVERLLDEREKTHGNFALNSHYGQTLRDIFRNSPGWKLATPRTREVLDYYAGKLSRILSGQPNEIQHHEDIAGYAKLAARPDLQR